MQALFWDTNAKCHTVDAQALSTGFCRVPIVFEGLLGIEFVEASTTTNITSPHSEVSYNTMRYLKTCLK